MRLAMRLFVAFCVGTLLAQGVVLGLAAARGNLNRETLYKALALLNGIDINGDRLRRILDESQNTPQPEYEDVQAERARQNMDLDMRERSIASAKSQVQELMLQFRDERAEFDRRKDEFYKFLEATEKKLLDEGLKEVQLTLETLPPEQAKEQLKKFLEADQMIDVVAIIKGMQHDKRKKILAEFTTEGEITQVSEILMAIRQGEPMVGLIQNARDPLASQ